MPKAPLVHYQQRVPEGLVWIDGVRRGGHHVSKPCRPRVKPLRDDAKYDVALGEDSDEAIVFNYHDCADVLVCHELGSFANESLRRSLENVSPPHHASDRLIEHGTP